MESVEVCSVWPVCSDQPVDCVRESEGGGGGERE